MDLHVEEKRKLHWQETVHKKLVKSFTTSKVINNDHYLYNNHINTNLITLAASSKT